MPAHKVNTALGYAEWESRQLDRSLERKRLVIFPERVAKAEPNCRWDYSFVLRRFVYLTNRASKRNANRKINGVI